jgi:hypothetical protein
MKSFKKFFYSLYFLYLAGTIFLAFRYEHYLNNNMFGFLSFLQWWAAIGLFLYIAEWIVENIHLRLLKNKISSLEKEKDALKVKMYDMETRPQEIDESIRAFKKSLPDKEEGDENTKI